MNRFIFKGKDPDGTQRGESVWALDAQAARASLEEKGWSDLQLVMDEVSDNASQTIERPEFARDQPTSPDDAVRYIEGKGPGFWNQYAKSLLESKNSILFFLLLVGVSIYAHKKWILYISLAALAFVVLLYPVLHAIFSLPSQWYARLNKAKVWSQWDEVLRCVERLRQITRLIHIGPGELELTRCRAQALAALGRLNEGMEEFSRFSKDPAVPSWNYLSFLAGIYDCAKQFEPAMECRRQAVAEKPDNSSLWIDLAYGLVRGLNRPAEAREALKRAETMEITQLGRPYLSFLRGIIGWREGDFPEARQHLEQALSAFQKYAHLPLIEGLILLTKSYLCAVHSALGDQPTAGNYFRETERFLEAAREDELLKACRAGLSRSAKAASV